MEAKKSSPKNTPKRPEAPTQSATMIILASCVIGGVISKVVVNAMEISGIYFTLIWTLGTVWYLQKTGNRRVAIIYLLVAIGLALLGFGLAYLMDR